MTLWIKLSTWNPVRWRSAAAEPSSVTFYVPDFQSVIDSFSLLPIKED